MNTIKIHNLSFQRKNERGKKFDILKNISLDIASNEVFAFIGPNGAGKTSTIKCILGFTKPQKGTTLFFDKILDQKLIKKIGYAPDEAMFYGHLTGLENMLFFGSLSDMQRQDIKKRGTELLQKVGLDFAANRHVKGYSQGMKQRLGIALSLLHNPDILIWDEPANGLDPLGRKLIKDLIKEQKQLGKTIFFSTHILGDVEEVADSFGLIHEGKLLAHQKIADLDGSLENFFLKKIQAQTKISDIK